MTNPIGVEDAIGGNRYRFRYRFMERGYWSTAVVRGIFLGVDATHIRIQRNVNERFKIKRDNLIGIEEL